MTFIWHLVLFFFSSFTGYLLNIDRQSALGVFLLIALPIVGVYFLGGWAFVTFFVGVVFGGYVFWNALESGRIDREQSWRRAY